MSQTISIELPDALYDNVERVAAATQRSLAEVITAQLAAALPPLDDVPAEEASALAALAGLPDAALWQVAREGLPTERWSDLDELLGAQDAGGLAEDERVRMDGMVAEYGERLVLQSHAWLLLARRGYNVPPQRSAIE